MSVRRLIGWGAVALIVFFVLSAPNDASGVVGSAFHGIGSAASSLATFARGLLS